MLSRAWRNPSAAAGGPECGSFPSPRYKPKPEAATTKALIAICHEVGGNETEQRALRSHGISNTSAPSAVYMPARNQKNAKAISPQFSPRRFGGRPRADVPV